MKYLFILLILLELFVLSTPKNIDGVCIENEDWTDAPCWGRQCTGSDAPPCVDPNWWKERWTPYYDYKGMDWMETKKIELLNAIKMNNVEEWKQNTPNGANSNVFDYYFYMGEIPNSEGKFVKEIFPTESSKFSFNILVFVIIIAFSGIGITIYWMKRNKN